MYSFKEKVLITIPVILLFIVLFGLYIPYLIYAQNANEFSFEYSSIFLPLLLRVCIWFIISGILVSFFSTRVFVVFITIFMVLGILFWFQADLFVSSYGVLDGSDFNFTEYTQRGVIELLIIVAVMLVAVYFRNSLVKHLSFICLLIAIAQISLVVVNNLSSKKERSESKGNLDPEFFYLSQNKNIILIVLDTFGSEYFSRVINAYPEYTDYFEGFVHYPDRGCSIFCVTDSELTRFAC